ncbi:MAG: orotidine 5'-phosphate decarboxylase / HUMPS family protein [Roseiflexaceae bacterium]
MMMTCSVQISLDLHDIADALHVADIAVAAGVDWLEAGTGLMVEQGLHVVTALRQRFPSHPIVCDFKVCDGARYFAKIAHAAGATHFDVMAASHDATLRAAGDAAREFGLVAIADIMFCADPVAAAVRAEALGVQMIGWHLGLDHRNEHRHLRAIDGLADVLKAVKIPVQVVGGLSIVDAITAARLGAASVVIGGPLVPADRGAQLADTLRQVVQGIKN